MTNHHYVLDKKGKPVIEKNLFTWARWFEECREQRIVAKTQITKSVKVSTVFLGLDHNFYSKGPPILWETMVFGGKLHHSMQRCAGSREQAEAMHEKMVKLVTKKEKSNERRKA